VGEGPYSKQEVLGSNPMPPTNRTKQNHHPAYTHIETTHGTIEIPGTLIFIYQLNINLKKKK
jgi:hypothetical protein